MSSLPRSHFWMSRNVSQKNRCFEGTLRDIQKTAARETYFLFILLKNI